VDIRHAYVVYDHARPANVKIISDWMSRHGIILEGRYSEWEYYNSDHAFLAGKKGADRVRELQAQKGFKFKDSGFGRIADTFDLTNAELAPE